jgi:hypothetical protein
LTTSLPIGAIAADAGMPDPIGWGAVSAWPD